MHGPATDLEHVVSEYELLSLLDGGHYVDYVLGGRGVFVIVHSEDPLVRSDFSYLKLGDGPFYVLHRPEVLVHYAAPRSIRRAAEGQATVAPRGAPIAETIAFAKRDLVAGQRLDGVGGFDTYGLIVPATDATRNSLLPVGLAQYARTCHPIFKDQPIRYADIQLEEDNLAIAMRREQDLLFTPPS
jgi:predicted homoserine dehydrogenase-like protein